MKLSEAAKLVGMLAAYFPGKEVTGDTVVLWAKEIAHFELEDAMEAAETFGTMGRFMPPLSEFVEGIVECRNSRLAKDPRALPGSKVPLLRGKRPSDDMGDLTESGEQRISFSQFLHDNPDMAERVKALSVKPSWAGRDEQSAGYLGLVGLLEHEGGPLVKDEDA